MDRLAGAPEALALPEALDLEPLPPPSDAAFSS
jgi:hypothetical protein